MWVWGNYIKFLSDIGTGKEGKLEILIIETKKKIEEENRTIYLMEFISI